MRSFKSRMGKEEGRGGGKEGGKEKERKGGREEKNRERCGEEKDMGELESGGVLGIFRDVIYIVLLICTSFFKKQVRRRSWRTGILKSSKNTEALSDLGCRGCGVAATRQKVMLAHDVLGYPPYFHTCSSQHLQCLVLHPDKSLLNKTHLPWNRLTKYLVQNAHAWWPLALIPDLLNIFRAWSWRLSFYYWKVEAGGSQVQS